MKYTPLPIETELGALTGAERAERREGLAVGLMSHPGFQLVTALLRDLETATLGALRTRTDHDTLQRLVGRLQLVDEIRTSLVALLPAAERGNVAWGDVAEEEWTGPMEAAGR